MIDLILFALAIVTIAFGVGLGFIKLADALARDD